MVKAEVARLQTRWRSSCSVGVFRVACLVSAECFFTDEYAFVVTLQHYSTQGKAVQIGQYKR